jgi:hypothetical protein
MTSPYYAVGKQVLCGRDDIAQACSNDMADRIASALNDCHVDEPIMPEIRGMIDLIEQVEPETITRIGHAVRREGDEYVCRCGIRWGIDEGDEHP